MYGVLPINDAVKVSVALMVVHQFVAFALYCTPLLYMWEKFIRTHTAPWYIRLPSRLPIGKQSAKPQHTLLQHPTQRVFAITAPLKPLPELSSLLLGC